MTGNGRQSGEWVGGREGCCSEKEVCFQYLWKDYLYYKNSHFPFEIQDLFELGNS